LASVGHIHWKYARILGNSSKTTQRSDKVLATFLLGSSTLVSWPARSIKEEFLNPQEKKKILQKNNFELKFSRSNIPAQIQAQIQA